MQTLSQSSFLSAFQGTNTRVPVWFMRQAGRYLPQYQAIKAKHTLQEMFSTPELAAEITCQPIGILGVDAAILFADILTLPALMGVDIQFHNTQGPLIAGRIASGADLEVLNDFKGSKALEATIQLVKNRLPANIPLIGFAGSPFTVLTYLVEGGSSSTFAKTFELMYREPKLYAQLMERLTHNTIAYLKFQIDAGIDCFQLFDSWAGILRPSDYAQFVLPYVQKIFSALDIPSIYFLKNTAHLLALADKSGADFLSVDHTVVLGHNTMLARTQKGIQGNLFNGCLLGEWSAVEAQVKDVLLGAQKHPKYIFNLSHGVLPSTPVENLKRVVDYVHAFQWSAQ